MKCCWCCDSVDDSEDDTILPQDSKVLNHQLHQMLGKHDIAHSWGLYKSVHSKRYKKEDDVYRFEIFRNAVKGVLEHNKRAEFGQVTYRVCLNFTSDMTDNEKNLLRGHRADLQIVRCGSTYIQHMFTKIKLPSKVDWREKGGVSNVKDQGQCGSCWAFSTTGSLEGQMYRKTGKLIPLSEQQLVDCSLNYGNMGCNGGLVDQAFEYIKECGGLQSEKDYPYTSGTTMHEDNCKFVKEKAIANVTGHIDIPEGKNELLMQALATVGPISIAINASPNDFMAYQSGIYDNPKAVGDRQNLDHAVLLVGYGTESGKDYWIVKNSWSPKWGENGYIRIVRDPRNICGVSTLASYPLV